MIRYFLLSDVAFRVLDLLDGRRSLQEIRSRINEDGVATQIGNIEILQLIMDLASKRLIWSQRHGTSSKLWSQTIEERWKRFGAVVKNPFFIRLPGLHPGQTLKTLSNTLGWIYSRVALVIATAFICGTWFFLLTHVATFWHELQNVSGLLAGDGLWTLWIVVGTLKIFHELSHGMACERFGAECHTVGLAFLFFSPCMYCDVTDAWMLKKKAHRIAISMAGIYVELVISSVALWLWWFSGTGLFHQVCLQVFLAGSVATVLFNVNPLLRFDGYYVLADLVEIPNLYVQSRQLSKRLAARILMGIRVPDNPATSSKESAPILLTYGLASMVYQIPMLLGLGLFLYEMVDPIGLAAVAWLGLVAISTISISRFLTWTTRMVSIQKTPVRTMIHSFLTLVCLSAAAVGIWFCPLGSSITAPVVVERQAMQSVFVQTPGTVRNVFVRDGDFVEQGTLLAELENLELDRQMVEFEGILATHETDFRLAQASGDPDLMLLAKTAIESITSQIEHARTERDGLKLRASVSGTLVSTTAHQRGERKNSAEPTDESAGIFNTRLIGMTLPRKTCLCEIAPNSQWQATLWVNQRSHPFVFVGQEVEVCLDAFPSTRVTGRVLAIGAANELEIPEVLSIKYGGQIASNSVAGVEQPVEPLYRATLAFDAFPIPSQHGMRGTGRFRRSARTVGTWLTDEFHRLFVVR